LCIKLEKFVYTKTHLAIRTHEFFRETKKQYKYLIINILKDIIMQSKKIIKWRYLITHFFVQVWSETVNFLLRS